MFYSEQKILPYFCISLVCTSSQSLRCEVGVKTPEIYVNVGLWRINHERWGRGLSCCLLMKDVVNFCISLAAPPSLLPFLKSISIHMDKPSLRSLCSVQKRKESISILLYSNLTAYIVTPFASILCPILVVCLSRLLWLSWFNWHNLWSVSPISGCGKMPKCIVSPNC